MTTTTVILLDGTRAKVVRDWHGKNDDWLEVEFERDGVTIRQSVELSDLLDFETDESREDRALDALIVKAMREGDDPRDFSERMMP